MKVLKLIAIVPLVLLSANSFAQSRQQDSRRDSYDDRDRGWDNDSRYDDRDRDRHYDSRYDNRDRYRNSGRRYNGARYSNAYSAPYAYYPPARPRLSVGIYDDYGYSSYGYGGYDAYAYYPPVAYRVYRPAPVLRLSLSLGGRSGRHVRRGRR